MLFIFYGQKLQSYMILNEVARSLIKLEKLKNDSRSQTIEYINKNIDVLLDRYGNNDEKSYFPILKIIISSLFFSPKIKYFFSTRPVSNTTSRIVQKLFFLVLFFRQHLECLKF